MNVATLLGWRKRLGFNEVEAAAALALSHNSLRAYETGCAAFPLLSCSAMSLRIAEIGDLYKARVRFLAPARSGYAHARSRSVNVI